MPNFLRNFSFDQLSFWIGFLTGLLFIWFFNKNRPFLDKVWEKVQDFVARTRQSLSAGTEHRYRMEVLRSAQRNHLAAEMFSLDEILIEPRILAAPASITPGKETYFSDLASTIIPYLPDWPELAAAYAYPSLNLVQALEHDANIILLGRPGAGKSVALAHLASQLSRQSPQLGDLSGHLPILIHVADLDFDTEDYSQPADLLINSVTSKSTSLTQPRLPGLLRQAFSDKKILLLLDGVDELPPRQVDQTVEYLHTLLKRNPKIRVIVTASHHYYDGLTKLGFIPVAMASWDRGQREWFLQNWSDLWHRHISQANQNNLEEIDPLVLTGWLLNENPSFTPLEFTLKVWSAFAGDVLGPQVKDSLEAYTRRIIQSDRDMRSTLESIAFSSVSSMQPVIPIKNLKKLVSSTERSISPNDQSDTQQTTRNGETTAMSKGITPLVETGILIQHPDDRLTFRHPVIAGFLAAKQLSLYENNNPLIKQPEWTGKSTALQFLIADKNITALVNSYSKRESDPLFRSPLTLGRWLRDAPKDAAWRTQAMRTLAVLIQNKALPTGLRARAATALALSNETGVSTLFKQLIASDDDMTRLLGVLGYGLCSDSPSVKELQDLLSDPTPVIRQAACLALVAVGSINALESLASAILHGEEDVRRAAAEALAHHPEEGHPVLKDGVTVDDLLVRRAVIHGLVKVREPWAIQILERMQIEDGQWVVRNAASQALEEISRPNPMIPRPRPALSETPWLIAFAGEHGIGISPGKSAQNLLVKALQEGDQDQRLAALDRLGLIASPEALPAIYHALYNAHGEVREAAFTALWHMAVAGVDLPPPSEISHEVPDPIIQDWKGEIP